MIGESSKKIPKGNEIGKSFANKIKSSKFRIGANTFYFDVNLAANNQKYLKVTESRYMGEDEDRIRNSVVIFPEQVADFQKNLKEMIGYL